MGFLAPKAPKPPAPVPVPEVTDTQVTEDKLRRNAGGGRASTLISSVGNSTTDANSQVKSKLLG